MVLDRNNANAPWYFLGAGTEYHTIQDHLKIKLAYAITPTPRAAYMLGYWENKSKGIRCLACATRPVSRFTADWSTNPRGAPRWACATAARSKLGKLAKPHDSHGAGQQRRDRGELNSSQQGSRVAEGAC